MMDWIRSYVLSIVAAGAISGICISMVPKNTSAGVIIKMLGGIFLTITMLAPLVRIRLDSLSDFTDQLAMDANLLVEEGSGATAQMQAAVIKQNLESYILDKAKELGVTLEVTVTMDANDPFVPSDVSLTGAVSPYNKQALARFIEEQLGIAEDRQVWN